ncbi:MAG: orotate phosphoribosyltransferase [Pantoea sp. Brub]|nr:orotate phosphoribosyltransferase [Pantoea sp. Brub]
MKNWKYQFIEFIFEKKIIKFGKFILKSGRTSPYFFNIGMLDNGSDLKKLGYFYTQALIDSKIEFDVIFGLAYKGILIVTSTAIAFANHYNKNIHYCFNRKEIKNYGEGGLLIGKKLYGRVVLIDDVITSGKSIHESVNIINSQKAMLCGVVVALDRQEYSINSNTSVIQEVKNNYKCPVISIITLSNLISYLKDEPKMSHELSKIYSHQIKFGIK